MLDLFSGIITNPVLQTSLLSIDFTEKREQKCLKP